MFLKCKRVIKDFISKGRKVKKHDENSYPSNSKSITTGHFAILCFFSQEAKQHRVVFRFMCFP